MMQPTLQRSHAPPPARLLPWLMLLFVGSGTAALIYEIVWFQLLQLVIGLTSVSLGVLLGTFMGGMCLGSLLLPRLISPRHHPLMVYAVLEVGIAITGAALLFLIPWLSQLYTGLAGTSAAGLALRGTIAALCLLPPTLLMGATLPAMARWIETTKEGVSWLGFFYGGNIAGAVLGSLLAGFYFLRIHDAVTATYAAAGLNLAVAAIAAVMAAKARKVEEPASSPAMADAAEASPASAPRSGLIYLAIALSGMAALGAEVVWTRLLSLLMGGSVYTFSLILAVFLVGLGIGSSAGAHIAGATRRPRLALGICQLLLMGAVAWAALMMATSLPYWPVDPSISRSPWFTFQLDLARGFWAMLPAALLWGASFPLALASIASRAQDSGKLVGQVYAANTVGAILGAVLFSLLAVPAFGSQQAQRFLVLVSAAAALLAFAADRWQRPAIEARRPGFSAPRFAALAALVGGLGFWLAWSVAPTPWGLVAYGRFTATFRNRLAPGIVHEENVPSHGVGPDIFCTFMGEGLNGSVAVTKWMSGVRSFHSAGKVQASTEPADMRLQRMLGHLSALLHQKPESVLVVACGAGVTAGSFVVHPEVQRIVICDIEPLVPTVVAPMFAQENFNVIGDKRTQVMSDDGRHFIRSTQEKFDIITSDPIDPWVKGCAALNTVEYYEMCKQKLKPGGIMTVWIPLYESSAETAKSLISTFFKVFPNGVLWSNDNEGEGYDAVLFGQAEPTKIDLDELEARVNRPDHEQVKASLNQVGFKSLNSLLSTYAGQARDLQPWMADAQINTDANLRLQYLAGMALNSYTASEILGEIEEHYQFPTNIFTGSEESLKKLKSRLQTEPGQRSK